MRLNRPLAALALTLLVGPAAAHPHIFIDAKAVVVFDPQGQVSAIRHSWTFDEAFSAWSIQGLDSNGDGATSPEEMQELADENMAGLAGYGFYTFAGEGNETIAFTQAGPARLSLVEGRTTLNFSVVPHAPYKIQTGLELAVGDPEYYVAVSFAGPEAVTLENAPAGCAAKMEAPEEMAPELADQLAALPPEVTELPPSLAAALRGVQGAILITCTGARPAPATALEAVDVVAQANPAPFGGPPPEPGLSLPRAGLFLWLAEQQRAFYNALNAALAELKTDGNAFWILGGLSFLYGVFHAAGPGHGKFLIGLYMLANETELRRGIALSFASAMVQSLVAVLFVLTAALLLNMTSLAMSDAANWIGIASYALVAGLGLWLIARKLFGFGHRHSSAPAMADHARAHLHAETEHSHHHHPHADGDEAHHHHDDHAHHHAVTPAHTRGNWQEQLGVVLTVGARPCSGALVVLVFALSQGVLPAGIAAVFLMGLGTAITVAVLASLAVGAKGATFRLAGVGGAGAVVVVWWLELAAAIGVFAFGAVLLIASL